MTARREGLLPEEARRTEQPGPHPDLDLLDAEALVRILVDDQLEAVRAVQRVTGALAQAAEAVAERLSRGGRLIYAGAGTSGRLATLDATELTPTFAWPPDRALALMAGGAAALTRAVEGAEDDPEAAKTDLAAVRLTEADALIVVAASGTTPYALGALAAGRAAGALTVTLANNPAAPLLESGHPILLDTGPEVIGGSTRLKAGTAQKIALNTLSSAVMVRLGKVHGNLMVDVLATNDKLRGRALRLTLAGSGADAGTAGAALQAAGGEVKTAIVMLRLGMDAAAARARLERAGGRVRGALGGQDTPDL